MSDASSGSSLTMAVGALGNTVQAMNGTTVYLGTEYNPGKCVLQFLSLECDDNCAELNGWELSCNKNGTQDGVERKVCECADDEASVCQLEANPDATSGTVAQFGDCTSAECVDSYGYISTSTEEGPICAEKLHCVQEVSATATELASICHTCMSCIAQNSVADASLAGIRRFNCTAICPQEVLDTIAEKNVAGVGIGDALSGSQSSEGSASVSGSAGSAPSPSPTPEPPLSNSAIAGIVIGVASLLVISALFAVARKRRSASKETNESDQQHRGYLGVQSPGSQPVQNGTAPSSTVSQQNSSTMRRDNEPGGMYHPPADQGSQLTASPPLRPSTAPIERVDFTPIEPPKQTIFWEDDIIITSRIPKDEIVLQHLLSSGAYGQVYLGIYDGDRVAVKMLRPELRKNVRDINAFLAEAKLAATMEHPHIVQFIGVSWKKLSDVCVVMEFVEGGDLRSLLDKYLSEGGVSRGFNREKVTIAFQVCQALTYMHTLPAPVIHRDLKSRNILLTRDLQARLTDFGISRERIDRTMTAGMGTMLWMAPEVMMGERYDEKADMFSFGVVLSELDVHTAPYASVKEAANQSGGRQLSDAAILQQVARGELRVEFSAAGSKPVTELGCNCVSVDPRVRPTAAQALYQLQLVLAEGLS